MCHPIMTRSSHCLQTQNGQYPLNAHLIRTGELACRYKEKNQSKGLSCSPHDLKDIYDGIKDIKCTVCDKRIEEEGQGLGAKHETANTMALLSQPQGHHGGQKTARNAPQQQHTFDVSSNFINKSSTGLADQARGSAQMAVENESTSSSIHHPPSVSRGASSHHASMPESTHLGHSTGGSSSHRASEPLAIGHFSTINGQIPTEVQNAAYDKRHDSYLARVQSVFDRPTPPPRNVQPRASQASGAYPRQQPAQAQPRHSDTTKRAHPSDAGEGSSAKRSRHDGEM